MPFDKVVLLAGKWDTTPIVYNFLKTQFSVDKAIVEESVSRKQFLQKRLRKLGWLAVSGQVLFQLLIAKPLSILSKKRVKEIIDHYKLSVDPIPAEMQFFVSSVNSEECLQELLSLKPDLIIVHGTRIISKKILQATDATFINIHAGITPQYRGSHGAYWALANNDRENCGVTAHLVDAGIDTGNVLAQTRITITAKDNFVTYPYLQLAEGLQLLKQVIPALDSGKNVVPENRSASALWHHPTIWDYVWKRLTRRVK